MMMLMTMGAGRGEELRCCNGDSMDKKMVDQVRLCASVPMARVSIIWLMMLITIGKIDKCYETHNPGDEVDYTGVTFAVVLGEQMEVQV